MAGTRQNLWQRKAQRIHFRNEDMDFSLLIPLAFGLERGSTVGECFAITARIQEGDPQSWADAWLEAAYRLQVQAAESQQQGAAVSAGESLLRAFTYLRTGLMVLSPTSGNGMAAYAAMQACFRKAMVLLGLPVTPVRIPYCGASLPGYWMAAPGAGCHPTLITTHGGEMFAEDLYFWVGAAALRRGYNVLSIDAPGGPGLRMTAPEQELRPFFLGEIRALVDGALNLPQCDPNRLAIMGFSGGAYLGLRLVSLDARPRALIATAPIHNFHALAMAEFPAFFQKLPPWLANPLASKLGGAWTRVALQRIQWAMGVDSLQEMLSLLREGGAIDVEEIACPVLCLTGASESAHQQTQAEDVYKQLTHPQRAFHRFSVAEGADAHCQINNLPRLHQITFDWLDTILEPSARESVGRYT